MRALRPFLVMGLLAAGCGGQPFDNAESKIEAALPKRIGPATAYDCRISRSMSNVLSGKVQWLEVSGRDVRPSPGLTLEQLNLRVDGIRFSRKRRRLKEIRNARIDVTVTDQAITHYLRQKDPKLQGVTISFFPQRVQIVAPGALVDAEGPLQLEGHPVLASPTTIDWKETRLIIALHNTRQDVLREFEDALNPIVDLSKLKFPVKLTRLEVGWGQLNLAGQARLTPELVQGLQPWSRRERMTQTTPTQQEPSHGG